MTKIIYIRIIYLSINNNILAQPDNYTWRTFRMSCFDSNYFPDNNFGFDYRPELVRGLVIVILSSTTRKGLGQFTRQPRPRTCANSSAKPLVCVNLQWKKSLIETNTRIKRHNIWNKFGLAVLKNNGNRFLDTEYTKYHQPISSMETNSYLHFQIFPER